MSFKWDGKPLALGLKELPIKVDMNVAAITEYQAARGEAHMKTTAPWTDRTSAARNGLFTTALHIYRVRHEIIFSHSVPYGIWLEVKYSGRDAVILPTIRVIGRDTMQQLDGLFGRMK